MTNSQVFGGGGKGAYENELLISLTIKFCIIIIDSGNYKAAINLTDFLLGLGPHWSFPFKKNKKA